VRIDQSKGWWLQRADFERGETIGAGGAPVNQQAHLTGSLTPAEIAAAQAATVPSDIDQSHALAEFTRKTGLAADLSDEWLKAVRTAEVPSVEPVAKGSEQE
jgi:hypothetical protein